jgi:tRNA(Ile)-lysidine synthase
VTGPDPAVAAVRTAVRAELQDLAPGERVLVACSGGADSLALAAATSFVAPRLGLVASAVVVDHGLQPGSARVAARAAAACEDLGVPAEVVAVAVDGAGSGPEAAARDARYAALEAAAGRRAAVAVLLGHTRDDQAEQVLLGLARGSGARSLAGMPARRGPFRRPLLGLGRATTEAACAALGLTPWVDPANADPAFARSRVRQRVVPVLEAELGPGVVAALARTADQLRADADALDALAGDLLRSATGDDASLDVAVLAAAPAALRTRALRAWLVLGGSPAGSLSREHVLRCDALLLDWHGQGPLQLPGRVVVRRACGRLFLASRSR